MNLSSGWSGFDDNDYAHRSPMRSRPRGSLRANASKANTTRKYNLGVINKDSR